MNSNIKVKSNGEHVVVLQMSPSEARLVSEALAAASQPQSEIGLALSRWYREQSETLLIQANEAAECQNEEHSRPESFDKLRPGLEAKACNHDSLVIY
jgi:hypothetical protein